MNLKIISGGQTGADLAGLWAAKLHNVPTGGLAPKNFMTLEGPKPSLATLFNLEESSGGYSKRTKLNVENSDLTLIVASNMTSPGTKLTIDACKKNNSFYVQHPFLSERNDSNTDITVDRVVNFINRDKLIYDDEIILNVAGNSTKSSFGAFEHTFVLVSEILVKLGYKSNSSMSYEAIAGVLKDQFTDCVYKNYVL